MSKSGHLRKKLNVDNVYTKSNRDEYVVKKGTGKDKQVDTSRTHVYTTLRREILSVVKPPVVSVSVRVELPKGAPSCDDGWPLGFSWEVENERGRVMVTEKNMEFLFGKLFDDEWKRSKNK